MKIFLLLIILFATACNTVQRQQRKAEQFYLLHPEKLAQKCAETYHGEDSVGGSDTSYRPANNVDYTKLFDSLNDAIEKQVAGYPKVVYDSNCIAEYNNLLEDQTTLKEQIKKLRHDYKPCMPDTTQIHDTIYSPPVQLLAENAYLKFQKDSLQNELIKTNTLKDQAEKQARTRLWILIIENVVFVGLIIIKLKKFI